MMIESNEEGAYLKVISLIGVLILVTISFGEDKVGLVLSGGGGRGAYEIGVWRALIDLDINIGGVYGTSVGSINGAAVAMGDYETARDLWLSIDYEQVMKLSPELMAVFERDWDKLSFSNTSRAIRELIAQSGIDVTPLREKLNSLVDEDKIRNSGTDYGLVTYSVSKLKPASLYIDEIPEGHLVDYILASSNLPVFQKEEIDGKRYLDGGIYSNLPIEMAKQRGFKTIVAVDIGSYGITDVRAMLDVYANDEINIVYIKTQKHYGSILTFDPEVSLKYIKAGYLDALKAYGVLQGDDYYIYGPSDIIGEVFLQLKPRDRVEALEILGIKAVDLAPPEYHYYTQLLPRIEGVTRLRGTPPDLSVTKLLEEIASLMELEVLRPYSPAELVQEIVRRSNDGQFDPDLISMISRIRYSGFLEFLVFIWDKEIDGSITTREGYDRIIETFSEFKLPSQN